MSIYQVITSKLDTQAAESFVYSIQNESAYFVFAAKHTPYSGSSDNVTPPLDTIQSQIQVYNDMIFGKRVKPEDVTIMIKRYQWKSGTVYAMYDDTDNALDNEPFYVITGSQIEQNVYKCLYRPSNPDGTGKPSIQEPFGKDPDPIEFPQDGYIWKYMYSVTDFDLRRFATQTYIPVIPNQEVVNSAVSGSIDIITVDQVGYGYDNYTSGSILQPSDVAIGANPQQYGLDFNASSVDGFYNNCLMKMTTGAGTNEYRLITNYYISGGKKIVVLDSPFNNTIRPNDKYEIYPNVFVYDTGGSSTSNCVARAIVSANSGNSISKIEVLNPGAGYRNVYTEIVPNNTVPVTTVAKTRAIMSPIGGHGSNPANELYGKYVGITTSFIGNNAPLSADNDYRTVGVLRDPRFANVSIRLDVTDIRGSFLKGETVYRYKPIKLFGNVSVYANSLVVGTETEFVDSLRNDDQVIITNGVSNMLANVSSIVSENQLEINIIPPFEAANCNMYLIESTRFGKVLYSDFASVTLTDVPATGYDKSSALLGETSFCSAGVSNTTPNAFINGRDNEDFSAFNQLTTFVGTQISGNQFIEDEVVVIDDDITYQSSAQQPSFIFHSIKDNVGSANDFLFGTNVTNRLSIPEGKTVNLRGLTSNAYFTATYKYNGEIVPDSGEILYLENLAPISRNPKQTETVKLILEF